MHSLTVSVSLILAACIGIGYLSRMKYGKVAQTAMFLLLGAGILSTGFTANVEAGARRDARIEKRQSRHQGGACADGSCTNGQCSAPSLTYIPPAPQTPNFNRAFAMPMAQPQQPQATAGRVILLDSPNCKCGIDCKCGLTPAVPAAPPTHVSKAFEAFPEKHGPEDIAVAVEAVEETFETLVAHLGSPANKPVFDSFGESHDPVTSAAPTSWDTFGE